MISYSGIELNEEHDCPAPESHPALVAGAGGPDGPAVTYVPARAARPPVVEPYDHNKNLWAILSGVITSPGSNDGR